MEPFETVRTALGGPWVAPLLLLVALGFLEAERTLTRRYRGEGKRVPRFVDLLDTGTAIIGLSGLVFLVLLGLGIVSHGVPALASWLNWPGATLIIAAATLGIITLVVVVQRLIDGPAPADEHEAAADTVRRIPAFIAVRREDRVAPAAPPRPVVVAAPADAQPAAQPRRGLFGSGRQQPAATGTTAATATIEGEIVGVSAAAATANVDTGWRLIPTQVVGAPPVDGENLQPRNRPGTAEIAMLRRRDREVDAARENPTTFLDLARSAAPTKKPGKLLVWLGAGAGISALALLVGVGYLIATGSPALGLLTPPVATSVPGNTGGTSVAGVGEAPTNPVVVTETIRKVSTSRLNLRADPGRGERVLDTLVRGAEVTLLGESRVIEGDEWVRVRYNGVEGWVSRQFLE